METKDAKIQRQRWKKTENVPIEDPEGRPLFGGQGKGNNLVAPCICGRPTLFTPGEKGGWKVGEVEEWKVCDHCKGEVLLREEHSPSRRFIREVRK